MENIKISQNVDQKIEKGILRLKQCKENNFIEASAVPASLDPDQYYQYFDNRYVNMVFWSVTGKCNYRCRHCYMDAPEGALGELSTEEAFALIDEMAACGVLRIDITGGEPLVRKDLWQLIDRICAYHMVIEQFYTNGWLLNDEVLDGFERRGLKPQIIFSFDGVNGWHDWMRGRVGAEEAALRAMKLCVRRRFRVAASMCVHRANFSTLPQTVETLGAIGVVHLNVCGIEETDLWRTHSEGNAFSQLEQMPPCSKHCKGAF